MQDGLVSTKQRSMKRHDNQMLELNHDFTKSYDGSNLLFDWLDS